jgi:pimeloyl-ACP methyl ester carboxylesterase
MLVQRVTTTRPDLVHTYSLIDGGVNGPMQWHDLAKQWQTPELGEQVMELMTPDAVEAVMRDNGHPDPAGLAARVDDTMKAAILALYRSAVDVGGEWAPGPASRSRPLLVMWGRDDPFAKAKRGQEIATTGDARLVLLDGGHWAAFEHPEETARELEAHWACA